MSAAKLRTLKSDPRIKLEADGRIIHVPVAFRNVVDRLNRKLGKDGERLRKARAASELSLGPYFIVGPTGGVVIHGIDEKGLEQMARQQGALRSWEEMTP
jgi:hypothetical protein